MAFSARRKTVTFAPTPDQNRKSAAGEPPRRRSNPPFGAAGSPAPARSNLPDAAPQIRGRRQRRDAQQSGRQRNPEDHVPAFGVASSASWPSRQTDQSASVGENAQQQKPSPNATPQRTENGVPVALGQHSADSPHGMDTRSDVASAADGLRRPALAGSNGLQEGHGASDNAVLQQSARGRSALAVGSRVRATIDGRKLLGTLRYVGRLHHVEREGTWVGVELDDPSGKNDGSVGGHQYFICAPNHGLLCRAAAVEEVYVTMISESEGEPEADDRARAGNAERSAVVGRSPGRGHAHGAPSSAERTHGSDDQAASQQGISTSSGSPCSPPKEPECAPVDDRCRCGKLLSIDSNFCSSCGRKRSCAQAEQQLSIEISTPERQSKKKPIPVGDDPAQNCVQTASDQPQKEISPPDSSALAGSLPGRSQFKWPRPQASSAHSPVVQHPSHVAALSASPADDGPEPSPTCTPSPAPRCAAMVLSAASADASADACPTSVRSSTRAAHPWPWSSSSSPVVSPCQGRQTVSTDPPRQVWSSAPHPHAQTAQLPSVWETKPLFQLGRPSTSPPSSPPHRPERLAERASQSCSSSQSPPRSPSQKSSPCWAEMQVQARPSKASPPVSPSPELACSEDQPLQTFSQSPSPSVSPSQELCQALAAVSPQSPTARGRWRPDNTTAESVLASTLRSHLNHMAGGPADVPWLVRRLVSEFDTKTEGVLDGEQFQRMLREGLCVGRADLGDEAFCKLVECLDPSRLGVTARAILKFIGHDINDGSCPVSAVHVHHSSPSSPVVRDTLTLRFEALELNRIDQSAFVKELLDHLRRRGVEETALANLRVRLREGSVIASICGRPGIMNVIRAKVVEKPVFVMGTKATVVEVWNTEETGAERVHEEIASPKVHSPAYGKVGRRPLSPMPHELPAEVVTSSPDGNDECAELRRCRGELVDMAWRLEQHTNQHCQHDRERHLAQQLDLLRIELTAVQEEVRLAKVEEPGCDELQALEYLVAEVAESRRAEWNEAEAARKLALEVLYAKEDAEASQAKACETLQDLGRNHEQKLAVIGGEVASWRREAEALEAFGAESQAQQRKGEKSVCAQLAWARFGLSVVQLDRHRGTPSILNVARVVAAKPQANARNLQAEVEELRKLHREANKHMQELELGCEQRVAILEQRCQAQLQLRAVEIQARDAKIAHLHARGQCSHLADVQCQLSATMDVAHLETIRGDADRIKASEQQGRAAANAAVASHAIATAVELLRREEQSAVAGFAARDAEIQDLRCRVLTAESRADCHEFQELQAWTLTEEQVEEAQAASRSEAYMAQLMCQQAAEIRELFDVHKRTAERLWESEIHARECEVREQRYHAETIAQKSELQALQRILDKQRGSLSPARKPKLATALGSASSVVGFDSALAVGDRDKAFRGAWISQSGWGADTLMQQRAGLYEQTSQSRFADSCEPHTLDRPAGHASSASSTTMLQSRYQLPSASVASPFLPMSPAAPPQRPRPSDSPSPPSPPLSPGDSTGEARTATSGVAQHQEWDACSKNATTLAPILMPSSLPPRHLPSSTTCPSTPPFLEKSMGTDTTGLFSTSGASSSFDEARSRQHLSPEPASELSPCKLMTGASVQQQLNDKVERVQDQDTESQCTLRKHGNLQWRSGSRTPLLRTASFGREALGSAVASDRRETATSKDSKYWDGNWSLHETLSRAALSVQSLADQAEFELKRTREELRSSVGTLR